MLFFAIWNRIYHKTSKPAQLFILLIIVVCYSISKTTL